MPQPTKAQPTKAQPAKAPLTQASPTKARREGRRRQREAGRDRTRQRWIAAFGIAAAAVLVGVAATMMVGEQRRMAVRHDGEATELKMLRQALLRVRRCLLPSERQVVLAEVRAELDDYQAVLLALLAQPGHELFAGCAALAADLELEPAIAPLATVVETAKGAPRRAALTALDRLQPLATPVLADMLHGEDPADVANVLAMVHRRDPFPDELCGQLLELVAHQDPAVRTAALECLPAELPEQQVGAVLALLDDERAALATVQLLARVPCTEATASVVVQRLRTSSDDDLPRWLPVLQTYVANPAVRSMLKDVVRDSQDDAMRIAAMTALETVAEPTPLPIGYEAWSPNLLYHAARLRVAQGDLGGVDLLLSLANGQDAAVAGQCRLALSRLSGMPPHAEPEALAAWRQRLQAVPARGLAAGR